MRLIALIPQEMAKFLVKVVDNNLRHLTVSKHKLQNNNQD